MKQHLAPHLAFAGFGLFWGSWGAALPGLRDTAGLTDAQLGTALLFVGLGALPAMALTGRAVDRFGARVTGVPLVGLALTGVLLAVTARDLVTVSVGMLLVGATSGAADVAANALAGFAERRSGRRVITLAHAVFSSFVVVGSLGAGALRAVSDGILPTFVLAGGLVASAGAAVLVVGDGPHPSGPAPASDRRGRLSTVLPFVAVGLVGALAFAAENAHQSWGAIFLTDELQAAPWLAAVAPATFATFAALTRFAVGWSSRVSEVPLLAGGSVTAVAGTVLLAVAHDIPAALVGLALAAVGTSVLFPTLLSLTTRGVPDSYRGRATSAVGTTAYLGFVLGPVYVGLLSGAVGLRGAMLGVAALAAAFAVLVPLVRPHAAPRLT